MTTAPRIAIVIPCYNAAATLAATLDSACSQDIATEIVVVDDGSSDESVQIARSFEPAVRVLTGPNRGASHARNRGIAECTADWIVFLDADDLLLPGTLALRLETAAASGGDVVVCDWQDICAGPGGEVSTGPRRTIDWAALARDGEVAIASHVWATTAAIMYRRSIVQRVGGFRSDLAVIQDARFLFDAAHHGARLVHADHVGAQYRIVPGSLSRRDPARVWRDVLLNGRQIERLWQARGVLDARHQRVLLDIYNTAARGLFTAGDRSYFEAIDSQRSLGLPVPRHTAMAGTLARLFGLRAARSVLVLVGRG